MTITADASLALAHGYTVADLDELARKAVAGPARKQFLRLWHQHETPRPAWGRDIRTNHRDQNHQSVTVVTIRRRERRRAMKAETTR